LPGRGRGWPGVLLHRRGTRKLRAAGAVLIARVLIWNLFESKTTLEELQEHLPLLPDDAYWISNPVSDRFGLVYIGEDPPDLGVLPELIGTEPVVAEEFDVIE
jgi:hypothetical protein